jgi:hypothetical protein
MVMAMPPLVKATTTPLASIFGSGFLVIVPILAGAVGPYSVVAMAGVCALAFAVGGVIRFNIAKAEPALADRPRGATLSLERSSDLALVLAYVISISLYLHILSAFVLGGLGADTGVNEDLLTTAIIVVIVAVGVTKGLKELEVLEQWALYITLVIILLIFIGFAHYDWTLWRASGALDLPAMPDRTGWEIATIVAGTLIVVQGFETPRYLGGSFDAQTRIRASRWSQIISCAVYVAFVALALPLTTALNGKFDDSSLLTMAGHASSLLVIPLIVAAALSQFSAAVADSIAATGNLEETTHHHIQSRWGYIIVGGGAIALTWSADTLEIVALASRAFAFYYMLQCFVAITVSESLVQKLGLSVIAGALCFVTIFAVPAS